MNFTWLYKTTVFPANFVGFIDRFDVLFTDLSPSYLLQVYSHSAFCPIVHWKSSTLNSGRWRGQYTLGCVLIPFNRLYVLIDLFWVVRRWVCDFQLRHSSHFFDVNAYFVVFDWVVFLVSLHFCWFWNHSYLNNKIICRDRYDSLSLIWWI
jgi:hypothetical protein